MSAREQRLVENEVRFRALNERLRQTGATWEGLDGLVRIVCECGDENCTTAIAVTPDEYETVRAEAAQFAIVPAHLVRDLEEIVDRHEDWLLVRKRGDAAEIAAARNPRSGERE